MGIVLPAVGAIEMIMPVPFLKEPVVVAEEENL